ncbi:MAG: hypothetical protein AAF236_02790 [Verrucomicrobiota bacterium]
MSRVLPLLLASLLLAPIAIGADDPSLAGAVVFEGEAAAEASESSSPFFAGWQGREVPANRLLSGDSAYQEISGFNFGFNADPEGRLQGLHTHVNVTEFQTLLDTGVTAILFENANTIISGRALGGYAFSHGDIEDSWHTSFDLFAARPLGKTGANFMKLGAFVDNQDDFGKWGPAVGLLLNADSARPITIDAAYGSGFGDPYTLGQSVYSVADDDFQIQAGLALSPKLQVGVTGQYLRWDGVFSQEEDWKTGGFLRYHSDRNFTVSIGGAGGEHGSTGFLHFTLRQKRASPLLVEGSAKNVNLVPDQGLGQSFARAWMLAPIQRQESLQIREESVPQTPVESPRGTLTCTVTDSAGSLGNLLAAIPAIHQVTYTNTGTQDQTVTINSIENFDGSVTAVGASATLAPGQALSAQGPEVATGAPPFNQSVVITVNGQQFNLTCAFPAGVAFGTTLAPIVIGP